MQEAQTFAIRLTAHHKPQPNTGKLRPFGAVPILVDCSFLVVVIVRLLSKYVLALFAECEGKITQIIRNYSRKREKYCKTQRNFVN